jgi:hypothetical protein
MTHRLDTIPLLANEARCTGLFCERKMKCARYLAAIPKGGKIGDLGRDVIWCMDYISLQSLRDSAKIKPQAPAKDWIGGKL